MPFKVCKECHSHVRIGDDKCWKCKSKNFSDRLVGGTPGRASEINNSSAKKHTNEKKNEERGFLFLVGIVTLVAIIFVIKSCLSSNTDKPSFKTTRSTERTTSTPELQCSGEDSDMCDTLGMMINLKGKGCFKLMKIRPSGKDTYRVTCELASYDRTPITYTFKFTNNRQSYVVY